jgi:hypothetical protein
LTISIAGIVGRVSAHEFHPLILRNAKKGLDALIC